MPNNKRTFITTSLQRGYQVLPYFVLTLINLYILRNLHLTYFQQDEWHNYGYLLFRGNFIRDVQYNAFAYLQGQGRVGAMFINFLLFSIAGPQTATYTVYAIVFQSINACLVYYWLTLLTKSKRISFIAATFFLVSSVSHQAVTWFGTITGTLLCMFFALLSIILFTKHMLEENNNYFYVSLVLLIISVLFRESSIFLLLFYPVFEFIYNKEKPIVYYIKKYWFLIAFLVIFVGRFLPYFFTTDTANYANASTGKKAFITKIVFNSLFYPYESFSQSFIDPKIIYYLTHKLAQTQFPAFAGNDAVEQTVGSQFMSFILTTLMLSVFAYLMITLKNKKKNLLLLFITFVLMSVLPQVIFVRSSAFLEARYMYFPALGAAAIVGLLYYLLVDVLSSKSKKESIRLTFTCVLLITLIGYFFVQENAIQRDISMLIKIGQERKNILTTILIQHPKIPQKTIFYTTSDVYMYRPDQSTMPFQSGFGQMLVVLYSYNNQLDRRMNDKEFLWGIFEEGYTEVDKQGFGYFRSYKKMVQTMKSHNLSPVSVIAYQWKKGRLEEITSDVQKNLVKDIASK
jgi:hypothetical protein